MNQGPFLTTRCSVRNTNLCVRGLRKFMGAWVCVRAVMNSGDQYLYHQSIHDLIPVVLGLNLMHLFSKVAHKSLQFECIERSVKLLRKYHRLPTIP